MAFKKDSQELSAAKLRDQMKVIIQASIEEDEEKIRYLDKIPKLAWTHLDQEVSQSVEDPDQIKSDSNPKKIQKTPRLLKRNLVANSHAEAKTVSKNIKLNLIFTSPF